MFDKRFYVQCDSSNLGIGAVLLDAEGLERPIAFHSAQLTSAQRNYTVTERECLAVISAIRKFRPFIEMLPFTVLTDHSALKWLMSQKELSGRLARWSLKLQTYQFDIQHRKGSQNVVADTLSRLQVDEINMFVNETPIIDLNSSEFQSEEYFDLRKHIEEHKTQLPDLRIQDNFVYKRTLPSDGNPIHENLIWKLWIPSALTQELIRNSHKPTVKSHCGIGKTLALLKQYFFWPRMAVQVRNYINNCSLFKEIKAPNRILRPEMGSETVTYRPWQKIFIDYIFIILDHLTKFVILKAMRKASAVNVVRFLESEVFHKFGVPQVVHSDNGKQFVAVEFSSLLSKYGCHHIRNAVYSPQANASERVNRSIVSSIRTYVSNDQRDWDRHLSAIECSLRSTIYNSTQFAPYFALYGLNMVTQASAYEIAKKLGALEESEIDILPKNNVLELVRDKIRDNLHIAYERSSKVYNTRARVVRFLPGKEILRRNFVLSNASKNINSKLCKKFVKCRIVKPIGRSLYEIEDLNGKPIGMFHAKDLQHAAPVK